MYHTSFPVGLVFLDLDAVAVRACAGRLAAVVGDHVLARQQGPAASNCRSDLVLGAAELLELSSDQPC